MAHPKLPDGKWARDWDTCRRCGRTKYPHCGGGLCKSCFNYVHVVLPKRKNLSRKEVERRTREPVNFNRGEESGMSRDEAQAKMSQYMQGLGETLKKAKKDA